MPTIQALKKKLRGIRSTQKIAKAMKTASTVKFSKLNGLYSGYSKYSAEYRALYDRYKREYDEYFAPKDKTAPVCLIVIASNKGMCGSFNSEMMKFATGLIESEDKPLSIILCGKKAQSYFEEKGLEYEKAFVFGDVPKYEEAAELFEYVSDALAEGRISAIKLAYPKYRNMLSQSPTVCELFTDTLPSSHESNDSSSLFFPDKESVISATAKELFSAFLFGNLLESALGAQAATLMTMRSAYDTASEYSIQLEGEINRKRQSQVTADVIETSTEHSQEN